jgi:tripartite-type tricarboxylate transporter receptor subunit TctC
MRRLLIVAASLLCMVTMVLPVLAADKYPSRPITYSIAFPPGGQSDLEARRQQPYLEEMLGQKIIIQYKSGGGGSICWADLVKQKPDGYFVAGINIPHIILQPIERGDAGYETDQLTPIAIFQATALGLAVMKDSPFKTLKDLIEYAKANPGKIVAGGSGTWSGPHLAFLQFSKLADIKMTWVPYKGAAPGVAAFLGGHIQVTVANSNDLVAHKDKIRVLAMGTDERFKHFPDTPTFQELGYDMTALVDRGMAGPPGFPEEAVKALEKACLDIASKPEVVEALERDGFVVRRLNAAQTAAYIKKKTSELLPILNEFKAK